MVPHTIIFPRVWMHRSRVFANRIVMFVFLNHRRNASLECYATTFIFRKCWRKAICGLINGITRFTHEVLRYRHIFHVRLGYARCAFFAITAFWVMNEWLVDTMTYDCWLLMLSLLSELFRFTVLASNFARFWDIFSNPVIDLSTIIRLFLNFDYVGVALLCRN